jgi:hypothetical protein
VKTVKEPKKPNTVHEIEPNPSKGRAMHEGDNPSVMLRSKRVEIQNKCEN